ncbi:hypothetical protein H4R33_006788, partial [Dimargaris cristalligena]
PWAVEWLPTTKLHIAPWTGSLTRRDFPYPTTRPTTSPFWLNTTPMSKLARSSPTG